MIGEKSFIFRVSIVPRPKKIMLRIINGISIQIIFLIAVNPS